MPQSISSSIQSFNQGWLGQFSSDPTLDGYGNPVIAGAQYYNNVSNVIRIYSGTSWSNYNPSNALAVSSANLAQFYATQAGTSASSAGVSSSNASTSATSASTSASTATIQAANASTSATNASNSAINAMGSATSASSSASSASTSAATATTQATTATTQATNAAASAATATTQATNAGNSATSASTSASSATTSATNAASSATSASTSATSATASATTATTQATNASNSATAAANSAANAAATLANALLKPNNLSDVGNAATARLNLSAAASGSNSDITSINGLTTALSIAQGGTGAITASAALTNLGTQPTNNPTFTGNVGVPTRTAGDSTANAASTAFLAAAIAPMTGKNAIINGACTVAQRASIVCSTGVTGYGGPDRFFGANIGSAGGQFTQSQGTITFGGIAKSAVLQTVNTAVASLTGSNVWSGIVQAIEGFNCFNLLGQPASLSFIFNTNVTGTYSVAVRDYTANNSFVSTFAATANVPVKVSIPIASIPTSLTTPNSNGGGMLVNIGALNTGSISTSTLNSWQTGNFAVANTATNWGATGGNFISATEIQLETGTVATPFERRSYGEEFLLCQRYYWTQSSAVSTIAPAFGSTTSVNAIWVIPAMRASPGISASFGAGNFVGAAPSSSQWAIVASGVAYATISSGTMTTAFSAQGNIVFMSIYGMTLSLSPNEIQLGSAQFINASAEL